MPTGVGDYWVCELLVSGILIIIRGKCSAPVGFSAREMKNVFCSALAKSNMKMWEALVVWLFPQTVSLVILVRACRQKTHQCCYHFFIIKVFPVGVFASNASFDHFLEQFSKLKHNWSSFLMLD